MVLPDITTWTWTMPYLVWIAWPASVRVVGAAVELALDFGAALVPVPLVPAEAVGAALAGAVATAPNPDPDPIADSGWPAPGWVLKLSSAPTPAMVPRMLSTTRRMIELPYA